MSVVSWEIPKLGKENAVRGGWAGAAVFRCRLGGRIQLTNCETLFVALPLRLFSTVYNATTTTNQQPPKHALPRLVLPVVTKVYTQSI